MIVMPLATRNLYVRDLLERYTLIDCDRHGNVPGKIYLSSEDGKYWVKYCCGHTGTWTPDKRPKSILILLLEELMKS